MMEAVGCGVGFDHDVDGIAAVPAVGPVRHGLQLRGDELVADVDPHLCSCARVVFDLRL